MGRQVAVNASRSWKTRFRQFRIIAGTFLTHNFLTNPSSPTHSFIYYSTVDSTRVTARSKNATQAPGLLEVGSQRPSKTEAATERRAKVEAKQNKASSKAAGIKPVAGFEKADAPKHALDVNEMGPGMVVVWVSRMYLA